MDGTVATPISKSGMHNLQNSYLILTVTLTLTSTLTKSNSACSGTTSSLVVQQSLSTVYANGE